jgi:hypothetical protein
VIFTERRLAAILPDAPRWKLAPSPHHEAVRNRGAGKARALAARWFAVLALGSATPLARTETAPVPFTDFPALAPPPVGTQVLNLISPTVLEVTAVTAGSTKAPPDGPFPAPPAPEFSPDEFVVTVGGETVGVRAIGFRRRVVYAPLRPRDLRVGNVIYLRLASPIADQQPVEVSYRGAVPWLAKLRLQAVADPLRVGPALHVNQVGYAPDAPKTAVIGYYLGTLGELERPAPARFHILDLRSGHIVHRGSLTPRADRGMPHGWYRNVAEASFTGLRTPGEYRLVVPGHGASYPFFIHDGVPAAFARTYALGLYHQRCGAPNALPFTRFVHDACHTAPVEVPAGSVRRLKGFDETPPDADQFPYVRRGRFDASGGHHDAGDYSKYTINSAGLIHHLVFAADNFPGVAALDNLGLPESGDGRSDVLQIARWEADFLARLQDDDGGFYFLVYPRDRRYEDNVLPDRGDPQIVWPKNSAATAAAVAALAQCASSPAFRAAFPDAAKHYLEVARRGWEFLMAAEKRLGRGNTYRKFTHYGDLFGDADEIAWAACELYLATGDPAFERELLARFDPRNSETRRWGWRRMTDAYGHAIRSYAFAARSGRLEANGLERRMLQACEDEIIACAEDWLRAARESAYGTSYPEQTKRTGSAGWYFSTDNAFDLAVAAQLDFPPKADRRPAFQEAVYSNLNYDAGANPVNVCFVTGLGWRRPLEVVHQYGQNDRRALPVSGIPVGSIQDGFMWFAAYKGELGAHSHPSDGAKTAPYPILDRWGDAFNVKTEFVVVNQARALATTAWLMAQSPLREQPWKAAPGEIRGAPPVGRLHQPVTLRLHAPGVDLDDARIVWEGRDHAPVFARELSFTARNAGEQWVEVEAQLPDGRRIFAVATFSAR